MKAELENVQVWIVRLESEDHERWQALLDEAELEKMRRFRMPADRVRFGVTRGVLRALLARYLGRTPGAIEFTYGAHGKPELRDREIQFNISHSGDFALLAFSSGQAVGVDVERVAGERVVSDLARRVLTPWEYSALRGERMFFEIWTLKEALLKAIGSGLSIGPEEVELEFAARPPRVKRSPVAGAWSLALIEVDTGYAAAVAVEQETPVIADVRYLHE